MLFFAASFLSMPPRRFSPRFATIFAFAFRSDAAHRFADAMVTSPRRPLSMQSRALRLLTARRDARYSERHALRDAMLARAQSSSLMARRERSVMPLCQFTPPRDIAC